jgi:hypothetical protein
MAMLIKPDGILKVTIMIMIMIQYLYVWSFDYYNQSWYDYYDWY